METRGHGMSPLTGIRGMLVAAGLGTRLAPLTDMLPKPAVPVGNRPIAAYMLEHFRAQGITEVVVNLHHRPDALRRALLPYAPGTRLRFVQEPILLGTGGGVKNALSQWPDGDVVVANAKLLFAPDLAAAMARHRACGAFATLILQPMPKERLFGPVYMDDAGWVRRILGPVPARGEGLQQMMFTGVQILSAAARARLPEQGCAIREGYMRWLAEGLPVAAVVDDGTFRDVGMSLSTYHDANMAVRSRRFPWPGVTADEHGNLLAQDIEVAAGARLRDCVVGRGARIAPGRACERLVVWPGATVTIPLTDAIVTPRGVHALPNRH